MRGWLRRNAIGLVCVLVSLPLLGVVLVVLPLSDRSGQEDVVQVVPPGRSGVLDGLRYQVLLADEFGPDQQVTTPDGTVLAAAALQVTPTGSAPRARNCAFRLVSAADGDRRVWTTISSTEQYRYARGEGFAQTCDARPTGAYRAETVFLVPAGTLDRATLDVTVTTGIRTLVLRLRLPKPAPSQQAG